MNKSISKPKFAFFGTPEIAVFALEELKQAGYLPELVVTNPDARSGRKNLLTPPPAKIWAETNDIAVLQPSTLKDHETLKELTETKWDFFVVLAYGKIMPDWLINLPQYGTINAHPSLLPKLRGPSPIRSTLLYDPEAAGVTIIQMDNQVDHGPILLQEAYPLTEPVSGLFLDEKLAKLSGQLLAEALELLPTGEIIPQEQEHELATFTQKITKEMGEVNIDPSNLPRGKRAFEIYQRILALDGWPGTYFFHAGKRIKIQHARFENDRLVIERIIPEGRAEMSFSDYFNRH